MCSLALHTAEVIARRDLSADAAAEAARLLALAEVPAAEKKDFLRALQVKGDSVVELTAFATVYRGLARDPGLADWAPRAIDIVGTGGTGSGGYNVSSVAAITVAAAGVPVLKHGNRAITSRSGSADFLPAIGITLQDDPQILRAMLEETGFCFFFAPAFHPAFKEIMPVRRELAAEGLRTIFNVLGPLINPARPHHQLLGAAHAEWVGPLSEALTQLGLKRGLAVQSTLPSGTRIDEFCTAGLNTIAGIGEWSARRERATPESLGFNVCPEADLIGGDTAANVALFEAMLEGRGRPGLLDTICLNAGAALHIMGAVGDLAAGLCPGPRGLSRGGALRDWLARARAFHARLPQR